MANNFYDQFLEAQKSMFNTWNNYVSPMSETEKTIEEKEDFSPAEYFKDMAELNKKMFEKYYNVSPMEMPTNPMDAYKKMMEASPVDFASIMKSDEIGNAWKNIMGFNEMMVNQNFQNPQEIWKDLNSNFDNYISSYQLWKSLTKRDKLDLDAVEDIYDNWRNQYSNYMKTYFIPSMAEEMREPMYKYLDFANSYSDTVTEIAKPAMQNTADMTSVYLKSLKNGPQEYFNYMKEAGEGMNQSFSKFLNSPFSVNDEEFNNIQKDLVDRMNKYNASLNDYYAKVNEVIKDASKDGIEQYIQLVNDGLKPKTFEEFYKFWTDKRNEFVENAFLSEDFNEVVDGAIKAYTTFRDDNEEILREYFSFLQIPSKSDIEKLTKKVDMMAADVAELKNIVKR